MEQGRRGVLYLDRDGTLIVERHYLADPEGVALLPGVVEGLRKARAAGLVTVLVSNQSGVARGYFPESRVGEIHERLRALLAREGVQLDALYHCPHHLEGSVIGYARPCECRKPLPGMVNQARADLQLEGLPEAVIGDKRVDLDLARAVGAAAVLVRTGYGAAEEQLLVGTDAAPDTVASTLLEAVDWCLARWGISPAG